MAEQGSIIEVFDYIAHRLSHDVRSPLAVMHEYCALLLDQISGPLNKEQADYVHVLLSNVKVMDQYLLDILTLSRCAIGKLQNYQEHFSLTELVQQVITELKPLADRNHITINSQLGNLPVVNEDKMQLSLILKHLLSNAIKYAGEDGRILCNVKVDETEAACLLIEISDNGKGIAKKQLDSIFKLEWDAQPKAADDGLGLGLRICKELVDLHKGQLTIDSSVGIGTKVGCSLPICVIE